MEMDGETFKNLQRVPPFYLVPKSIPSKTMDYWSRGH